MAQPISRAVLITGSSSGIGRATAAHLAQRGWTVYAGVRQIDRLADPELAGCRTLALDVNDEDSMREAVARVEREAGAVGVLINNAGYSQSGAVESVPLDLVRRQFETNVFGLVRMTQLVLPGMRRQRWGKVVNLSSIGGRMTFPGGAYYHATKHAVEAITDALRFEVRGFEIDAVLIEPGIVRTRFAETAAHSVDETGLELRSDDPYGRFNAEVARTTREIYERGVLAQLGADADAAARVIERAITARRPHARYRVGASAPLFLAARRLLPDRAWDAMLRMEYQRPE